MILLPLVTVKFQVVKPLVFIEEIFTELIQHCTDYIKECRSSKEHTQILLGLPSWASAGWPVRCLFRPFGHVAKARTKLSRLIYYGGSWIYTSRPLGLQFIKEAWQYYPSANCSEMEF